MLEIIVTAIVVLVSIAFGYYLGATRNRTSETNRDYGEY